MGPNNTREGGGTQIPLWVHGAHMVKNEAGGEGCPLTGFFSVQDFYIASLKSLLLSVELSEPMTLV